MSFLKNLLFPKNSAAIKTPETSIEYFQDFVAPSAINITTNYIQINNSGTINPNINLTGQLGNGSSMWKLAYIENIYAKTKEKCFAMGFKAEELPSWIKGVSDVSEIENNSWVVIDEGGILFGSRNSMSSANKLLSQLILISRHKNINILFISQNSSNLEVNILRQADFLALRKSSLLQKDFERKIIQRLYSETQEKFEKHKLEKGLTYIYSEQFKGFVSNPLPSFWKEEISKSFK